MKIPLKIIAITITILLIIIIVIAKVSGFFTIGVKQTQLSPEEWTQDVKYLKKKITAKHANIYSNITHNEFNRLVDQLIEDIPHLDNDQIQFRILELVANIKDSHTTVFNFITDADLCYPMELYWFEDGYYVVNAIEKYKHLLGSKIVGVNGEPIDVILSGLLALIPHENIYRVRYKGSEFIRDPRFLKYLGITQDSNVMFSFVNRNNEYTEIPMSPMKINSLDLVENMGGRYSLIKDTRSNNFEYMDDRNILYFKFYRSRFTDVITNSVIKEIQSGAADKLIIDLRNNVGGSYISNSKLVKAIKNNKKINQRGNLIVIVGRGTFSSGIMYAAELKKNTSAIFYGELTGGKPNHFGDVRFFRLPNSGLVISCSTKYFNVFDEELDSFYPDIVSVFSINDYLDGIDPFLDGILRNIHE